MASSAAATNTDHPMEGIGGETNSGESVRSSRKKSSHHHGHRRHRPSVENDGLLPLTEESFKSLTTNEMERGLLETLMATSDSSTLKRDKRRKSVKERPGGRSSAQRHVSRSRTREIDA